MLFENMCVQLAGSAGPREATAVLGGSAGRTRHKRTSQWVFIGVVYKDLIELYRKQEEISDIRRFCCVGTVT